MNSIVYLGYLGGDIKTSLDVKTYSAIGSLGKTSFKIPVKIYFISNPNDGRLLARLVIVPRTYVQQPAQGNRPAITSTIDSPSNVVVSAPSLKTAGIPNVTTFFIGNARDDNYNIDIRLKYASSVFSFIAFPKNIDEIKYYCGFDVNTLIAQILDPGTTTWASMPGIEWKPIPGVASFPQPKISKSNIPGYSPPMYPPSKWVAMMNYSPINLLGSNASIQQGDVIYSIKNPNNDVATLKAIPGKTLADLIYNTPLIWGHGRNPWGAFDKALEIFTIAVIAEIAAGAAIGAGGAASAGTGAGTATTAAAPAAAATTAAAPAAAATTAAAPAAASGITASQVATGASAAGAVGKAVTGGGGGAGPAVPSTSGGVLSTAAGTLVQALPGIVQAGSALAPALTSYEQAQAAKTAAQAAQNAPVAPAGGAGVSSNLIPIGALLGLLALLAFSS
jgi:hypothetical protein